MKRSRRLIVILVTLVAVAPVAYQYWSGTYPAVPEVPATIDDEEIRQAIETARQKVLTQRYSAANWGQLACVFAAHHLDHEAAKCFREAARLDPTEALWLYGQALIDLKEDPKTGLNGLRRAAQLARSADKAALNLRLAEVLLDRQQYDEAEAILREELRLDPGSPRAALGLGQLALALGRTEEAQQLLQYAKSARPATAKALAGLAVLARQAGDTKSAEALQREQEAQNVEIPWPDPLLDRIARLQVGRVARERVVAQLERQGRYEEAAEFHLREHRRQPSATACIGAAVNLFRLHDLARAIPLAEEALRLDPQSAQAHFTRALLYFARAEQNPTAEEAKAALLTALASARRTVELKPDHALAYLLWGLCLRHLGQAAAAIEPLQRGVTCSPGDAELHLALGETFLAIGAPAQARRYLENARQIAPDDPRLRQAIERLPRP